MYKAILDAIVGLLTTDPRTAALEKVWRGRTGDVTGFAKWAAVYPESATGDAFRTNRSKTFELFVTITVAALNMSDMASADEDLENLLDDGAGNGILRIFRDFGNHALSGSVETVSVDGIDFDNALGDAAYIAIAHVRLRCLVRYAYIDT